MKYNDSYEALGDLLYPSIAASGNVYYGQTRKLALDEIFKDGFRSTIEADVSSDEPLMFFWEVGPLKGSVRLSTYEEFPTSLYNGFIRFVKYNLVITTTPEQHSESGIVTYKRDISAVPDTSTPMFIGPYNPMDSSNIWDGRDFYIDADNSCIYIAVVSNEIKSKIIEQAKNLKENIDKPLTVKNTDRQFACTIKLFNPFSGTVFKFRKNDGDWVQFNKNDSEELHDPDDEYWSNLYPTPVHLGYTILLKPGDYAQFELVSSSGYSIDPESEPLNILQFKSRGSGNSPCLEISGNILSLIRSDYATNHELIHDCEFLYLFSYNDDIADISKLALPSTVLRYGCYSAMFMGASIKNAPALPATVLADSCYESMFESCNHLKYPPMILPARQLCDRCYASMFSASDGWTIKLNSYPIIAADDHINTNDMEEMFTNCDTDATLCIYADEIESSKESHILVYEYGYTGRPQVYIKATQYSISGGGSIGDTLSIVAVRRTDQGGAKHLDVYASYALIADAPWLAEFYFNSDSVYSTDSVIDKYPTEYDKWVKPISYNSRVKVTSQDLSVDTSKLAMTTTGRLEILSESAQLSTVDGALLQVDPNFVNITAPMGVQIGPYPKYISVGDSSHPKSTVYIEGSIELGHSYGDSPLYYHKGLFKVTDNAVFTDNLPAAVNISAVGGYFDTADYFIVMTDESKKIYILSNGDYGADTNDAAFTNIGSSPYTLAVARCTQLPPLDTDNTGYCIIPVGDDGSYGVICCFKAGSSFNYTHYHSFNEVYIDDYEYSSTLNIRDTDCNGIFLISDNYSRYSICSLVVEMYQEDGYTKSRAKFKSLYSVQGTRDADGIILDDHSMILKSNPLQSEALYVNAHLGYIVAITASEVDEYVFKYKKSFMKYINISQATQNGSDKIVVRVDQGLYENDSDYMFVSKLS